MSNMMRTWLRLATTAEQHALAQRVGTSHNYLFHIAAPDKARYKREPKIELAGAIERVTAEMHKESKGRLPKILRTDLVTGCRNCEYAQRCLKGLTVRSEFPLVEGGE